MQTVQLSKEAQATLTRNLQNDKRFVNAKRRAEKRKRDEQRKKARAEKAMALVAAMSAPQPAEQPDLTLQVAAACIDRFPVKIGKVWVR